MTFSAPDESEAGPLISGWLAEQPDIKTVLGLADPYRPGFINLVQTYLDAAEELGVESLGLIEVPETTNYGPVATKALSYEPDAIIMGTMEDATAKLIIEWNRRGFTATDNILIFRFTDTAQLYEAGEGYLDGCYIASVSNAQSDNPAWVDLAARYAVELPDPGIPSWNVPLKYDDILLIAQAIEETKATGCPDKLQEERLAIRDYIRNAKDFEGIQFNRSFTDGIAEPNVFLFQIVNNEKVFIKRCE
jgi:ABC-type branched-subunit amino acid transport system substrate-binding protein